MISDKTTSLECKIVNESNKYKNLLFGSFSHEFRTPLNMIMLMTTCLMNTDEIPEQIKD